MCIIDRGVPGALYRGTTLAEAVVFKAFTGRRNFVFTHPLGMTIDIDSFVNRMSLFVKKGYGCKTRAHRFGYYQAVDLVNRLLIKRGYSLLPSRNDLF